MNLHKAYYKDYFNGVVNWSDMKDQKNAAAVKRKNNALVQTKLSMPNEIDESLQNYKFKATVQYPGLVTGVGINHEAGVEGEFKLGLHFDWTWGMPVVYGSSVKGVLSAYFKDFYKPTTTQPTIDDAFNDIFEGKRGEESKSIYNRDIFFDAFFTKGDSKGRILCSDSITPHPEPLKNPIPIPFLKIAAGSTIEFRFKLVDTMIDGKTLTASDKLNLFREILTTVGVGAKTNVGYGQLKKL